MSHGLKGYVGHKARHQDGGDDELDLTALSGLLATSQTPAAHKTSHQDAGSDEISVLGLSGLLADSQIPLAHSTDKHEAAVLDTLVKLLAQNVRPTYNRVAGLTPTVSDFDTSPTTLTNLTDGDWTTETGEGIITQAGNNVKIGYIIFDMGAAYPVLIIFNALGYRVSGDGNPAINIEMSVDNSTWYNSGSSTLQETASPTVESYRSHLAPFLYARYFRLRCYTQSCTTNPSEYRFEGTEVMALQLL